MNTQKNTELRGDPLISTPPASGWRSMVSAPKGSQRCLGVISPHGFIRIISPREDGRLWRSDNGFLYDISEIRAWAPIPEWTGEVAE